MEEATVSVVNSATLQRVFGTCDKYLRKIRTALRVSVTVHQGRIHVSGDPDDILKATKLFERLQELVQKHGSLCDDDIDRAIGEVLEGQDVSDIRPLIVFSGRQVRPRTAGQVRYIESIKNNGVVFCIGPAGTGKTYLAVAAAVSALKSERVRKIVLVRPAVEAGESLGYLPGDLQAKINPYLRPLFDALNEMLDPEMRRTLMQDDVIEVIPLAYMRGRTLSNAFIILDEAQNTTISQMKMFLTRMGEGSKIVVCGDTTQVDLPNNKMSGLKDAANRLHNIQGCDIVHLRRSDIVRHRLVQAIVEAYEED